MAYITVEGDRIFYTTDAKTNKAPLLAIHGAGGDHRHWPVDLRAMPAANWIVVDLPGHGRSGGSGRTSVEAYADFVQSMVAVLQLKSLTLVGHSMGGAIVQALALRRLSWLSKIVLVGTGAKLRIVSEILHLLETDYPKAVEVICCWAFGEVISGAMLDQYRKGLLQTAPEVTRNDFLACNEFDRMETVSGIRIPTLIVSGSADRLTPPKYGRYLQERIRGSLHTIISDAGHMMALEKPAEFIEAVAAFMM